MTGTGTTMKSFQKRIYTVLPRPTPASSSSNAIPRVRSNSASSSRSLFTGNTSPVLPLSFFDSPPPSGSRPSYNISTTRPPVNSIHGVEAEVQANSFTQTVSLPYSLALTPPQSHFSVLPISLPSQSSSFFASPYTPTPSPTASHQTRSVPSKFTRYHLDAGAYGIPKRSKNFSSNPHDGRGMFQSLNPQSDGSMAVQVGEDAYFIRDNAMGVADGVGGWSRTVHRTDLSTRRNPLAEPSPSAHFARRLMHYCSAEVMSVSEPIFDTPTASPHPKSVSLNADKAFPRVHGFWSSEHAELQKDLQSSLEELEDGLDVLLILEKAYESTLRAHVSPPSPPPCTQGVPLERSRSNTPTDVAPSRSTSPPTSPLLKAIQPILSPSSTATEPTPLLAGSSTALIAVLDYSPRKHSTDHSPSHSASLPSSPQSPSIESVGAAVIKIAHLGDCMAMLVRGEEIAWRSEEMWWSFNTPAQLGPCSSTRPCDAQVFTLPVEADDILILASDGLSDNLWDEEVLDEVVRFRRSFLDSSQPAGLGHVLGRKSLAGLLSEALCSRAHRVAERGRTSSPRARLLKEEPMDEVPFARRAREEGRLFRGGKSDDISVVVAVISPTEPTGSASL